MIDANKEKQYERDHKVVVEVMSRIILMNKICEQDFKEGITHQDLEDDIEVLQSILDVNDG